MNAWADLETTLDPVPEFLVEAPDGRKDRPELGRQVEFRRLMQALAPRVLVYANANAGKRNPAQARKEGILGGVFDLTVLWRRDLIAYVEFKGYDARGRAGHLSRNQIEFGNRLVELDIPCAAFFDPLSAVNWLRVQGFPLAETRYAA